MTTAAFFRARNMLVRYTIVLVAIAVLGITTTLGHVHSEHGPTHVDMPLGPMLYVCGVFGLIVASIAAANLSRERLLLALAWTRPAQRETEALRTILIDLATIIAAILVTFAVVIAGLIVFSLAGGFHGLPWQFSDANEMPEAVLITFGASAMWYGIVAAATAAFPKPATAWFAWPAFVLITFLAGTHLLRGFGLEPTVQLLTTVDPFTYIQSFRSAPGVVGYFGDIDMTKVAISYIIAAIGCAIAIVGWSRKEYSR